MKQFIYKSDFNSGPEATKKQEMLFTADLNYALSEGYEFIKTSDGVTFQILDAENLIETDITEEMLQSAYAAMEAEPETLEFDPESVEHKDADDLLNHNLFLIQSIINNTLSKESDITPQQAETMIKLGHLSNMLLEGSVEC